MNELRKWMKKNHLTQAQLAEQLGYHPITVAKILNNMMPMTPSFIGRFAQTFGFDVAAELFGNGNGPDGGDDDPEPGPQTAFVEAA